MAQYARPSGVDSWEGWETNPFYDALDETSPNDSDFIQTPLSPNYPLIYLLLSPIGDPATSSGHILRFRFRKSAASSMDIGFGVQLLETDTDGPFLAEYYPVATSDSWVTDTYNLDAGQADSITDYANLILRIDSYTVGTGTSVRGQISWIEFETPDLPGKGPSGILRPKMVWPVTRYLTGG